MKLIAFLFLVFVSSAASAQNWLSMGQMTDYGVTTLYNDTLTNSLIAGGAFKYVDGKTVNGIASWNGVTWDSLAGGITNCVNYCQGPRDIVRYNGDLYVCGQFTEINHVQGRFAKWNGIYWDTTGLQVSWDSAGTQEVSPSTLTVINNELWVCGGFYKAGGILINNGIGKWNGSNYSTYTTAALPPVYNGPPIVASPVFYNGMWYFISVIMDSLGYNRNVVRWTGAQWEIFGGGISGGLSEVSRMLIYQNKLYLAGTFTQADGNPENAIVTWDGSNWGTVGGGITDSGGYYGQIFDMTIYNNELWVVGNFQMAGGIYAKNIAKWNGSQWCSLGNYFDNTITTIEAYNNEIYIGGGFWTIDGDSIQRIAKWVGGNYIANCSTVGIGENTPVSDFSIFPNPVTENVGLQFNALTGNDLCIRITDMLGQTVIAINEKNISGNFEEKINVSSISKGIYLVTVQIGNQNSITKKLIKLP